ncbi:cytochrome P450 [Lenzites betulinus]|nr:cytochrome P450 [Lenzites betulinus]
MSLSTAEPWLLCLCASLLIYISKHFRRRTAQQPLPPGPRALPIIGNALDLPTKNMPAVVQDLCSRHGEVVYLNVFGQSMLLLGSHEAAVELLDKRSLIYSDRKSSAMAQLSGWDWMITVLPYGPDLKRHRKAFHQHFNSTIVPSYRDLQKNEAHRFALRLIQDPENFQRYIRFVFASTIMRISYGIVLDGMNDKYVDIAEAALAVFNIAFIPGKYLVETFPSLRCLPSWLPGAGFKREGTVWKPAVHRLRDTPYEHTLTKMEDGTAPPSMLRSLLEDISTDEDDATATEARRVSRNAAAAAYAGGADTTLSSVQTFFLAMAAHPEIQQKAQVELDTVVGQHRLPDFSDMDSLPYVRALAMECLRWRAVVPLGFPHCSTEDDVFRGYFIPKGTMVIANIWAYLNDPKHYPGPEKFTPERFLKDGQLNPDVLDPTNIAFGYGRRICPGRHFAEASLFVLTATVLHTLTISAPLDANGNPVKLHGRMTEGVISYPEPFEAVLKPRGPWAEALLRESCKNDAV